jgi:two-component system OmpR family response regulator
MKVQSQVLVVDDDVEIGNLLAKFLISYNFGVHVARNGHDMRTTLAEQPIDVVIMDVMLPVIDGISLTRELRQQSRMPIIMLSARTDYYDRVLGLENGADDYVTKPFEPRELVARIQAVLRRSAVVDSLEAVAHGGRLCFDGWTFDPDGHSLLTPDGLNVTLSNAEFRLLTAFVRAPRKLLSREQLRRAVSGHAMGVGERSIDLLISRLRQKLTLPHAPVETIKTIRGQGYLFDAVPVRNSRVDLAPR